MFYRMLGILVLTFAAYGAAFAWVIRSRKPDLAKPGISSFLTASGMVMVGVGLMIYGNPVWKFLVALGAWEYAAGAMIAFYRIRQKRS